MLGRIGFALSIVVIVACGDTESGTSASSNAGGAASAGGNGVGASGGNGTGANGGAGAGGSPPLICGPDVVFTPAFGCDVTMLDTRFNEELVTIGYGFSNNEFIYEPKCVHVCSGTTIRFEPLDGTNFGIHPLQGGEPMGMPGSPFGFIDDANESIAEFTLTEPGSFPYYCVAHLSSGMAGVVYVQ